MAKEFAKHFYKTAAWIAFRQSFISERMMLDGGLCMDCHDNPGYIVHHWPVPLSPDNIDDPNVTLSTSNVRWVCKDCHDKYPGHGVGGEMICPKIIFDEDGDPLPPPIKNF
jgi:5-methylcytosine-specific restriction protein A